MKKIKTMRVKAKEKEIDESGLPKFKLSLNEELIIYCYYLGGFYWVRIARERPFEILWSQAQRIPFWESDNVRQQTIKAMREHAPTITDEKIKEIVDWFRNSALDIPDLSDYGRKPKKERRASEEIEISDELPEIILSEDERKKAEEFLSAPDLLNKIGKILDLKIVGEYKLKILTFCCAVLAALKESAGIIIVDPSSIGKSTLLGRVVGLFPDCIVEQPTSFSAKSLNYLARNYEGRILRVDEIYGAEEGMADLRVWMSEGRLERWIALGEDEGIELKKLVVEGAPVFLTSTTQTLVDEQLLTRNWLCHMDPSAEQTKNIHKRQAREWKYPPKFFAEEMEQIETLKAAIKYIFLNARPVLIPYADRIEFPAEDIRARRDFPRFLQLIASVALIHLLHRPRIRAKDEEEYILATLEDFERALDIAFPFLETTIKGLDKTALEVYNLIVANYSAPDSKFTVPELSKLAAAGLKRRIASRTIRDKLAALEERGLVIAERSKKPHEFQLAPISSAVGAPAISLAPFSEKEALEWLISTCAEVRGVGGFIHTTPLENVARAVCVKGSPPLQIRTSPAGQDLGENSAKGGESFGGEAYRRRYESDLPKEGEIGEIKETPKKPTVSDLQRRLWEVFGALPFKPSQLSKHFTDEELVRLTKVMDRMRERGELIIVPLESGMYAFQLVKKG